MKFKFLTFIFIASISFFSCQENGPNDASETKGNGLLDEMFSKNPIDQLDEKNIKAALNLPEDVFINKSSYKTGENGEAGLIQYKEVVNGEEEDISISVLREQYPEQDKARDKINNALKNGTYHKDRKITYVPIGDLGEGAIWNEEFQRMYWYKGNSFYKLTVKGNSKREDLIKSIIKMASNI